MFAIPTGDQTAFFVDVADTEFWTVHYLSFDPLTSDSFEVDHYGSALTATVNTETQAAWILGDHILAVSRELRISQGVPFPVDGLAPFDLRLLGNYYYLCCAQANVWAFNRDTDTWEPRLEPGPRPEIPPRGDTETAADYVDRTYPIMDRYARDNPDTYAAFAAGDAHYVVGALGRIIRFRGDTPDQMWLDSGVRLIDGFEEDGAITLCGDSPVAEIYRGSMEDGFELIFFSEEQALHKTALHGGTRYIGAGLHEDYADTALFTLEDGALVPVETGCAREPGNLMQLLSTGSVLWAIDGGGFFRLKDGAWTLTEMRDIVGEDG